MTLDRYTPGSAWWGQNHRENDRAVILSVDEEYDIVTFTLIYGESALYPGVHAWMRDMFEEDFYPVRTVAPASYMTKD